VRALILLIARIVFLPIFYSIFYRADRFLFGSSPVADSPSRQLLVKLAALSVNFSAVELTVATGQNMFFLQRFLLLSVAHRVSGFIAAWASPIDSQQSASAEYAAMSQALWSSIPIRVCRSVFISSFFITSVPGFVFLQRTKGVILCSSHSSFPVAGTVGLVHRIKCSSFLDFYRALMIVSNSRM
jgi:hypothetical protein